jgi:hypothetical protein
VRRMPCIGDPEALAILLLRAGASCSTLAAAGRECGLFLAAFRRSPTVPIAHCPVPAQMWPGPPQMWPVPALMWALHVVLSCSYECLMNKDENPWTAAQRMCDRSGHKSVCCYVPSSLNLLRNLKLLLKLRPLLLK